MGSSLSKYVKFEKTMAKNAKKRTKPGNVDKKTVKKEVTKPSRGQRKRLGKKSRLDSKKAFIKAAHDNDEILLTGEAESDVVQDASRLEPSQQKRKRKKMLETKDLQLFQKVLDCKPFQANPLGALKEHLENAMRLQK